MAGQEEHSVSGPSEPEGSILTLPQSDLPLHIILEF